MKKTLYILIFLVFAFSCKKPNSSDNYNWKDISINRSIALKTLYMVDDDVGFVGGSSNIEIINIINHLGNGTFGDTLVYYPDNDDFYREYEFNNNGIDEPILYKTIDGGISWQEILTPFKIGIKDMQFLTGNVGYVATEGEGVYKTTDGGKSWIKVIENIIHYYDGNVYINPFNSICFVDVNTGFVYDNTQNSNVLFSTCDGGSSWRCISISYPPNLSGSYPSLFDELNNVMFFNNTDTGYVVNGSELYKTVDLGINWEKIYVSKSSNKLNVFFVTPQIGYIPDYKLYTKDGGITWQTDNSLIPAENMFIIEQNEFYYVSNGEIVKKVANDPKTYYMTKEIDKPVYELFFPSVNVGYAIGVSSLVLKYNRI